MRVTTFLTGLTIGAMAGIYLADRRSFGQLQSKLQMAGDVVNDVVGMARHRVIDTALDAFAQGSAASTQPSATPTPKASALTEHHTPHLDQVKELINRDPEVKRQVEALLRESGLSSAQTASEKTSSPAVVAHESNAGHKSSSQRQSQSH